MAIKKGIKCGTGLATGAGAVLSAGEVAAFLLQVEALRRELESITYQGEVANAAPHVAEFTLDLLSDAGFMEWIRKWSCFPAGTQVVVGVEPDESLPSGRRYITRAIETLRPGDMVLARQEFGERLGLRPVLDVFHNRAAHLRWLTVETPDGRTSELPTTDSHPFWVHECQAWVEAGSLQPGLTFNGPHQQPVKLRSTRLEEFPELRPVYTLEVHDDPTFFVLPAGSSVPVLVHNTKTCVKAGHGTKGNATDGASKSGAKTENHHSDPVFMGGRKNQKLTEMPVEQHRELHKDLNEFLRQKADETGNHMRPQRGNSGERIRGNFSSDELRNAMADFYRKHRSKYKEAAKDFFEQYPSLDHE